MLPKYETFFFPLKYFMGFRNSGKQLCLTLQVTSDRGQLLAQAKCGSCVLWELNQKQDLGRDSLVGS